MSGGSSSNNSWTILTPEETVTETLKPLAEGTEQHEDSLSSEADPGVTQPAQGEESVEEPPMEGHLVPEEQPAELSEDTNAEQHTAVPAAVIDDTIPTTVEASGSLVPDSDPLSQSEGLPEGPAQSIPDPDSFSDSYTHITPSPEEPPASLLSTETLGGGEFTQEEESVTQEGTVQPLNGEGLQQVEEESDLFSRTPDIGKQADTHVDSEVAEVQTEKTAEEREPEPEPEVRSRSLLAALERIGRKEEEEEEEVEEEFQLPPREEDSGFSVNKCILGAVILLGLGTIFISDNDYATRELKDAEIPGKQEWLNPEVPPPIVDVDSAELLNKLAQGDQQISVLQAQLQAQREELNVAKEVAEQRAKDHLLWAEVEKENSRLKKDMASLPILQKENERMKRELESVVALQTELETLRSTVTELKLSQAAREAAVPPPSGQPEDSIQVTDGSTETLTTKTSDEPREEKKDVKSEAEREKSVRKEERKEWKKAKDEREKSAREEERKEWKKAKEEQKRHSEETKIGKEKDWKKHTASRGDEGKSWKDREGKKEKDKNGRKEWKEEKELKKGKHEKVYEGKQWKGKEEKKDWKVGKDHGEKYKGKENWKGEKEWKKGKDSFKEIGKEKWEKKGWKEKGEKKEWKKESDWKSKDSKKWKERGERKQWEDSKSQGKGKYQNDNEWKRKSGMSDKEWKKKDEKKEQKWKREGQKENSDSVNRGHKEAPLWEHREPAHSHRKPSLDQPEYWTQQRDRLQHNTKPPQHCGTLESCAKAEGLIPVPLPEFEAILQIYLTKAEEVGLDDLKREELKKLTSEFFKDGVFVHDQMSFQDFVEDVGDILEDMVEDDEDEEEEDSALEEEMEGFEREVMKKFAVPGAREKEERSKGERKKASGRGRG
ncbi:pre-B-cell leukemia homeobox interacting protein 1b isoform X3 [Xyrichtys novacula]|uniref:Pre-B-cell leukemia homeobox interacting protein 1b isoform X3 n=1 Tax=Xyrichtys novacula TaxID=13765 RepID=A0AAV1FNA8_XYRNO|nr:pre-B-cell leukemia homeobox interacting protein 1b isoform X3 [Xyrichtys novacula]